MIIDNKKKSIKLMSNEELIRESIEYARIWYTDDKKVYNTPRYVDLLEELVNRLSVLANPR
jgi:hypothetical protein